MQLSQLQKEFLVSNIQNIVPSPICICDSEWNIVVLIGTNTLPIETIIDKYSKNRDLEDVRMEYSHELQPYVINGIVIGYIFIFGFSVTPSVFPFIFALLDLLLGNNSSNHSEWLQDVRTQLANQLAFYDKTNWEILAFMKQLQCSYSIPRCAVLFYLPGLETDSKPLSSQTAISLLHSTSTFFSSEDIFGPIGQDKFLVFKSISGANLKEKISIANAYASNLISLLKKVYNFSARAYIGSPYVKLEKLHNSFLEAQFLYNNSHFLNKGQNLTLAIDKYLFPYLFTLLPSQIKEIMFKDFDLALGNAHHLLQTIDAITTNCDNLTHAAQELGIHRNTILQRFGKIQGSLSIDPRHNDNDRSAIYCYSLFKNQTITWHACVNIQPGNIQHRGLEKFSELLRDMSHGAMQLNIEVISKAGDYRQLFESVCSGKIDCVSINTGPLFSSIRGWPHILELPFLFDSPDEADHLLNDYISQEMAPAFHAMGVVLAGFWSMGWRYLTSNETIRIPEDMKSKRIRLMFFTKIMKEYFQSMGATVIMANYNDIPESLETGIVDCQENPYSNILAMEFNKWQTYVTELNAFYDVNAVLFSKSAWERLPAKMQQVVISAFSETRVWMLHETERINLNARDELVRKGMQIIHPNPEEVELWKKASADVYASTQNHFLLKGLLHEKEVYSVK